MLDSAVAHFRYPSVCAYVITWRSDRTTSGAPHGLLCLRLPVNETGFPPQPTVSRLHKQAQIFLGTATLEKGAAGRWWVVLSFKTLR